MTPTSLAFAAALVLALAPALSAQDTPRMGGVLKVASIGEPPTLDIPMSTATLVYEIMWHVNESLFTYDKGFNPVPLLAESHAVTDKGLRHTITLRKGVKFHNGKEMTSADVVPSLRRWGRVASIGRSLWKYVESVDAKDPYTVVISLKQPCASLIYGLSEPHAAVYPKESIDAAGEGQLKELIGTGPYRFVEHKPDRHIKLARFKDYSARAEPPSGFGGKRTAWLDEILFLTVPDTAVRLAGVETGEYHHAMFVKQDSYDRVKGLPSLAPRIVKPRGWAVAVLNHKAGPMMLRQAVQAALDMEPILVGGFGSREFYRLDPGLFFPERPWHSTASSKLYNQHDKDKARRLVKEAGYTGQPIRWVTTREYGELQVEMDLKKRKAIVDRLQTVFYEEVGSVKLGDFFTLDVARRDLRGEFRTAPRLYFWNSWLAK
jgi:peptide/nickel transport system substrate-binding protein